MKKQPCFLQDCPFFRISIPRLKIITPTVTFASHKPFKSLTMVFAIINRRWIAVIAYGFSKRIKILATRTTSFIRRRIVIATWISRTAVRTTGRPTVRTPVRTIRTAVRIATVFFKGPIFANAQHDGGNDDNRRQPQNDENRFFLQLRKGDNQRLPRLHLL